ncbi:beta-ketoacyl-[acyl-carrier-protein] synthase family protein [Clostridium sp. CF011]|uniref:beta-ketoacyl-[acyl-carrier-protein] synthase family protein n=1 Tax=Clostridium sp. CF011 TaxID=2843318 RepID=UPI001C0AE862|nr:beta-ketoacyl-[acyl-carrier-protein] synthase family protein [Clostridium sp. CF011]MBU3093586.1 beta-ketoacyl-[acyl-carrier-protein] synthase family protein [Clostridium sp. CF011]WAG71691.1 beta-ketoacyl-[acyl-carrier-protein] synthase family protein [Clostridium sp. CF011]
MIDKIVITGISAVTPLGNNLDEIAKNLEDGKSGIGYVNRYNLNGFPVRHGGIIDLKDLETIDYPYEENLQFKLFYYCLKQLYEQFKDSYESNRVGCIIGTNPNIATIDDVKFLGDKYMKKKQLEPIDNMKDELYIKKMININPSLLLYYAAKDFNINGPCLCNFGTCSASTQAIGDSYRLLKSKKVDLVVCGGISMNLDPIAIARLCRLKALELTKEDVSENCSPFDKRRAGFTIGEGSILFTLEREEDAIRRKAKIYAEIKGYGAAMDGFSLTDPHEEALGMSLSMMRALEDAKLSIKDIDYLNAHGTGTKKNDKFETMAIKKVFKEYASQLDISSTKSMHGHSLTAGGAMEVLACIMSINNEFIPPTINYKLEDPECDLLYNPNKSKKKQVLNALTNNFGLGGINASLVVSKYI